MELDFIGGFDSLKKERPLIHCITSPIAINDCANAVLAVGASPIMAEHPKEVAEIVRRAKGLSVSLANITDVRAESMGIALEAARESSVKSVIDLVGITCSQFRKELFMDSGMFLAISISSSSASCADMLRTDVASMAAYRGFT